MIVVNRRNALLALGAAGVALGAMSLESATARAAAPREGTAANRVMPVIHGVVVLRRGLEKVELRGPGSVVQAPNEGNDSYLVRRAVTPRSLPASLRDLPGRSLTMLRPDGTTCTTRVGPTFAYAWIMPLSTSSAWDRLSGGALVRNTFERGTRFLGAETAEEQCNRGWATFEPATSIRLLAVTTASAPLRSKALSELQRLPAFASRQAEYVTFKQDQERIRRLRIAGKQKVPEDPRLRDEWIALAGGETKAWVVKGSGLPALLVAYIRRTPIGPVILEPNSKGEYHNFLASLVAVWRLEEGPPPKLELLGPPDGGGTRFEFVLEGAASGGTGSPELLYSGNTGSGTLVPTEGRYDFSGPELFPTVE